MSYAIAPTLDSFATELSNSFNEENSNNQHAFKTTTNSYYREKSHRLKEGSQNLKNAISSPNQEVYEINQSENNNGLTKELMKDNTFSENYFISSLEIEEIDTIPDDILTKPINDLITKTKKELDKKIRTLLSQKVVYFEKHLECYGVIDNIYIENKIRYIDARIYDIKSNTIMDNITFEAKEFPENDQRVLSENSVFYWRIGKDHKLFGGHRKVSEFRLRRRVIKLSPAQLKQKQQDINETISFFESIFNKNT
ncbi:hypothetical protein [Citrobacter sp. wls620]|uniref:hypothetical protein n=1 Tax=Citrobacter sp. wls620 TaxID=2576431 RepID=UPI0010C9F184|nr:hypothetical protein [Citrobacter sp. wls620]TKU93754.1 hypothetical protein FDW90_10135 [Citrobacter sp. wls620]